MRTVLGWLPVIGLFGSASCAFLLDFDELGAEAGSDASLGGTGGAAGAGGAVSGGGGASGSGGAGGAGGTSDAGDAGDAADAGPLACTGMEASTECDDGDPCTTDVCVKDDAGPGLCFHGGKLFDDGQIDLPVHDYLGGLSVAGGSGRFYVSKYFGTKKPDAGPFAYDYETAVFEVPVAGPLKKGAEQLLGAGGGLARGPVGLVNAGGKVKGFVAVEAGFLDWRVRELEFADDLSAAPIAVDLCAAGCYAATIDGTRRPVPYIAPGGKPGAMWIGPGGVWIGSAGAKPDKHYIGSAAVTGAAPVVSDSAVGALWRDQSQINLTFPDNGQTGKITSCHASPTLFAGLATAGRGRLWVGAFARPSPMVTEFNTFYLSGATWLEIETCKSGDDPTLQGVSLPGLVSYQRPVGSSSERFHFAVAGVTESSGELWAGASYVELAQGQLEVVAVGGFDMDGQPTAKLTSGSTVDEPAIAYADDKLLVAWRDSNTLRLRRFKVCK